MSNRIRSKNISARTQRKQALVNRAKLAMATFSHGGIYLSTICTWYNISPNRIKQSVYKGCGIRVAGKVIYG